MARYTILLVDDEKSIRFGIRNFLETQGYTVEEADSCRSAEEMFRASRPDLAIVDYQLQDGNALGLLPKLMKVAPSVPVIVLTGHGTIDLAVRAIKEGAKQFLTKPIEMTALRTVVRQTIEDQRNRQKEAAANARAARHVEEPFIGNSPAIRQLEEQARKVLPSDSPILIQGETGTGKGVLASWLHTSGPRREEAFVDLNCGGLSREFLETELFGHEKGAFTGAVARKTGLLDIGHRGTIFLDEIGDVPPEVQPKLLKVLEEKQFRRLGAVQNRLIDVRLIAATHQNLSMLVEQKKFRSDLYFRISTIPLVVPPLRERIEDIPLVVERLLQGLASDLGREDIRLAPDAMNALLGYTFPGNIRELRNILERAILLSDSNVLRRRDLHFQVPTGNSGFHGESTLKLQDLERRYIEHVLNEERGHVERAAQRLDVPRSSLYQKIKKYSLS